MKENLFKIICYSWLFKNAKTLKWIVIVKYQSVIRSKRKQKGIPQTEDVDISCCYVDLMHKNG